MIALEIIKKSPKYNGGLFTLCDGCEIVEYKKIEITIAELYEETLVGADLIVRNGDICLDDEIIGQIDYDTIGGLFFLYGPQYEFNGTLISEDQIEINLPIIKYEGEVLEILQPNDIIEKLDEVFLNNYPHLIVYEGENDGVMEISELDDALELTDEEADFLDEEEKLYLFYPSKFLEKYGTDKFEENSLLEYFKNQQ